MMKAKLKLIAAGMLVAVSAVALSSAAIADPVVGPYGQVGFGVQYATPTGSTSFKLGQSYAGALGWSFGNGWRAEGEFGYIGNKIDQFGHARVGGKMHGASFLVNGIYDFDKYPFFGILTPHVGLGMGYDAIHGGGFSSGGSISAHRIGFQGILGVEMPLTSAIKFDIDYRPMVTPDVRFTNAAGGLTKGNFVDENLLFSLRFDFAAPPAPPAPAPAPAPMPAAAPAPKPEAQRAFQVFFDFNKSDITSDAAAIIAQAAQTAVSGHIAKIEVTGHTDTVGTVKYNQKLSERRAAAVKAELIKDGVSGDSIDTIGVGKTGLLVPTPDGVREPQNRRAEIVLQ
jgi:outer membrane protein OmpA-like peptidoglycan-associated protein